MSGLKTHSLSVLAMAKNFVEVCKFELTQATLKVRVGRAGRRTEFLKILTYEGVLAVFEDDEELLKEERWSPRVV